jgi:site-specific DNA-adenine methylase
MRSFFFSYVGGKSRDLKHITPFINLSNIETVVEPFCGSCAFSTHNIKNNIKYVMNDNDKELIKFLNCVKNGGFSECCQYYNNTFNLCIEEMKPSTYFRELVKNKGRTVGEYFLLKRIGKNMGMCNLRARKVEEEEYAHLVNFFKNAEVTNNDYIQVFDKYINDEKAFLFLDPPYLDSCNVFYRNFNEKSKNKIIFDNTKMYIDILHLLRYAKCKVLLIINGNALTKYIYSGFIRGEYTKCYDLTKKITTHLIVCNYWDIQTKERRENSK